ncbi:thioesterase family protein [Stenotrophomonas sp. YAU14D1_LEIMI4_1]|uniref:thioesterase family protein n=1 Tax=Stenotrophomonas sp. YAU14D1_LEIMI4_1 TaxID=2072407 RepID=UPI000D53CCD0|nr:thioesterase family protein [Stenotrophomonas sp. YAU14D1_LEIMI4_1]AWH25797.1 Mesenchymal stem cell protein DSCD75 [Stenotrophomonas sp. YAU14D1_LEIMI4_1]
MNLWFRLLHLLLCSLFRPRLDAPFGVSRLQFRVLPNDLDSNLHMTNGRYWNIFDLGRLDLILRMGLGKVALREKWAPIVGAGTIQFRRELRPFQRYTLETRLAGWVGTRVIMEQRVLIGPEQKVATRALLVTGIYDRRARAFVGMERMMAAIGSATPPSPPLSAAAEALLAADAALKRDDG